MLTGRFSENSVGGDGTTMFFHVGANVDQREAIYIGTMNASRLGLEDITTKSKLSLSNANTANRAIGTLDEALKSISKQRADLGGYQNRFETAQKGVAIAWQNLQAAESIIRDSDMASLMVDYTKDSILTQSSTAMLAQANAKTQSVLQLLG
jgi:flagellin